MSESDVPLEITVGNPTPAAPPDRIQETIEFCTRFLVAMRATRPEILRGIRIHQALRYMPRHLLCADLASLHKRTVATDRFDQFWSHSWQARLWMKYLNILWLNNAVPANVVSILSASLAMVLMLGGFLDSSDYSWSLLFGATGYFFTFFVWRSRSSSSWISLALSRLRKLRRPRPLSAWAPS